MPSAGFNVGEDDSDEAEGSDAESEPLEYAVLGIAGALGAGASPVLGKVRQEQEKRQRLKQELASARRTSSGTLPATTP